MLEHALVSGICSAGADAFLAGVLPTPGLAFLAKDMGLDGGVMISASHNPFHDNGIKIFQGDGFKLSDNTEVELEELILKGNGGQAAFNKPEGVGRVHSIADAGDRYRAFLVRVVSEEKALAGLNVVLDCANGATCYVAPPIFADLGANVRSFFGEPDGTNINSDCGSEHPEKLADEVVRNGADVGFAFDGDGDRVICVDENGERVSGDKMLAVFAKAMKDKGQLPKNMVVSTVMSNIGLGIALKEFGIDHLTTQVGDKSVLREMLARGACVGGEDSGHMIFLDYHTTGDGIIAAVKVAEAIKNTKESLSELAGVMKVFPQTLINVEVKEKPPIETVPGIVAAIERVEKTLAGGGRVFVRYSGTQTMCRVMVEGPTHDETERFCKEIAGVVSRELG
jgi:phosphoglucosamine mutase